MKTRFFEYSSRSARIGRPRQCSSPALGATKPHMMRQQAGLAAAVRPGHAQQLAAIELEAQSAEQPLFPRVHSSRPRFKHCRNIPFMGSRLENFRAQRPFYPMEMANSCAASKVSEYRAMRQRHDPSTRTDPARVACACAAQIGGQ